MFDRLPLEIEKILAEYDESIWFKLYLFDEKFAKYAKSEDGCRDFVELFTVHEKYHKQVDWSENEKHFDSITETRLFGKLQSIYGEPALIINKDVYHWFHQGLLHRTGDLPAVIYIMDVMREYWQNGELYRDDDKPTVIAQDSSGEENHFWMKYNKNREPRTSSKYNYVPYRYQNEIKTNSAVNIYNRDDNDPPNEYYDILHRDNDKPAIIFSDGRQEWYQNGINHRDIRLGPAVITENDEEEYWENGIRSNSSRINKSELLPFPIEIITLIASFDEETWIKLYIYDANFAKFNELDTTHKLFIQLFTEHVYTSDYDATKLFGKFQSIYGNNAIDAYGNCLIWCHQGMLHRENDEPAVIYINGITEYWVNNVMPDRDNDLPTVEYPNGSEFWIKQTNFEYSIEDMTNYVPHKYYNGKICRPAAYMHESDVKPLISGILHRDNDEPAMVIYKNKRLYLEEWYQHGLRHRDGDKPARIYYSFKKDNKMYYRHGLKHRDIDKGPAVRIVGGDYEYWVNGKELVEMRIHKTSSSSDSEDNT